MILAFMNANGQEPDKIGKVLDTVSQFGDAELLDGLADATGLHFEPETANRLFGYKKEEPYSERKIPELDLGKYANHPDIVKIGNVNRSSGDSIKYTLEIISNRYLEQGSNLINNIKDYNQDLKNVEIEFTINGTPLPNKTIKL